MNKDEVINLIEDKIGSPAKASYRIEKFKVANKIASLNISVNDLGNGVIINWIKNITGLMINKLPAVDDPIYNDNYIINLSFTKGIYILNLFEIKELSKIVNKDDSI